MNDAQQSPYVDFYESPIGLFEICATETAITHVLFVETSDKREIKSSALVKKCRDQLAEYFQGNRRTFDLPLAPRGTAFQKSVWSELSKIPFGATTSYLEIGKRIGNTRAVRAIGGANGKNPINVIVPCHRVIGANGTLVGYGGGLWRKQWLLNHEKSTDCAR
ncbi:MAG: methylated-DNA--[protein]-cysteine S-methyltransferase [Candidatus Zhuqueibacterota bacterium]